MIHITILLYVYIFFIMYNAILFDNRTKFMDSKLVVQQVNNNWKINKIHLQKLKNKIDILKNKIELRLFHVRREYNTWADYYSKLAINENKKKDDKYFQI